MMRSLFGATLLLLLARDVFGQGVVPFDPRWDQPQYLGFRPANGEAVDVNPPRFSWSYEPEILSDWKSREPAREFVFQIAATPDMKNATVDRRVAWNFDNALSPLKAGLWYWRIGYADPGKEVDHWSPVRSFTVPESAQAWDRSALLEPLTQISTGHPRLQPKDGDWKAFLQRMKADPRLAPIWQDILTVAESGLQAPWWWNFPANDKTPESLTRKQGSALFKSVGDQLEAALFVYRVTGDERFRPALDLALKVASFPRGGETSPEFNGGSDKWGTRWAVTLARAYDWFHNDLAPEQRKLLSGAVAWRVNAILSRAASWRQEDGGVHSQGVAVFAQSHPYENINMATMALMLIARDEPSVDGLVAPMLNYAAGVGGNHGPDEAWNEAGAYVFFKASGAIQAALTIDAVLPSLKLGSSPWYRRLGEFMINFSWPGMNQQGYGEYARNMSTGERRGDLLKCLMLGSVLTQDGLMRKVWDELAAAPAGPRDLPQSLFLISADRLGVPAPSGAEPSSLLFRKEGWAFLGSFDPSDFPASQNGTRFSVMARPRGGYSHSYSHDGAYVWTAFGQALTGGGGSMTFSDPYARHAISHNGMLVEGRSPALRGFRGIYPWSARPIYWREDKDAVCFSMDLTGMFRAEPGKGDGGYAYAAALPQEWGYPDLKSWKRHLIFFGGRHLAIFDEISVRTDPARFSWIHHLPLGINAELASPDGKNRSLTYRVNEVNAALWQRSSTDVDAKIFEGRDVLVNPVTGTDYWPEIQKAYVRREKSERSWSDWVNPVMIATTPPRKKATYLTVLSSWKEAAEKPSVEFVDDTTVTLTTGGRVQTVSFSAAADSSISVDAREIAEAADAGDPFSLPDKGREGSIRIAGKTTAVLWLREDTFSDATWVNRWAFEGTALVFAAHDGLHVQSSSSVEKLSLTAPLPAEAVVQVRISSKGAVQLSLAGATFEWKGSETGDSELMLVSRQGRVQFFIDGKIAGEAEGTGSATLSLTASGPETVIKSVSLGKML